MIRRLLPIPAMAASLLLAIAVAAAWVRSEDRVEEWHLTRGGTTWSVSSYWGSLRLVGIKGTPYGPGVGHLALAWSSPSPKLGPGDVRPLMFARLPDPRLGFLVGSARGGLNPCEDFGPGSHLARWSTARLWVVLVPYWFVTACFAVAPLVWLRRSLRAVRVVRADERRRVGRCIICGYDLRASNERCPECGRPIETADA